MTAAATIVCVIPTLVVAGTLAARAQPPSQSAKMAACPRMAQDVQTVLVPTASVIAAVRQARVRPR